MVWRVRNAQILAGISSAGYEFITLPRPHRPRGPSDTARQYGSTVQMLFRFAGNVTLGQDSAFGDGLD
jgi:hypothetical protein